MWNNFEGMFHINKGQQNWITKWEKNSTPGNSDTNSAMMTAYTVILENKILFKSRPLL